MKSMIVCGYDVRQIRGSQELALILHSLDCEEMKVYTSIRLVTEDPSEVQKYLNDRRYRYGEKISNGGTRPVKLNIRGSETTGRVAGHSITVDRWFGLRAWVWIDMMSDQGPVNVPVLQSTQALDTMQRELEESEADMLSAYISGTMVNLQDQYRLRSVWQVKLRGDGRYVFTTDRVPDVPELDTAGGEELPA
jgi:hypothetical protein